MALLQISEPDIADFTPQSKFTVGIDLGTTNSLIATVVNKKIVFYTDENNSTLVPSKVSYSSDSPVQVGNDVKKISNTSHDRTLVSSVKRLIGKGLDDIDINLFPYEIEEDTSKSGNGVLIKTCKGKISPVKVSSDFLFSLKKKAEVFFGNEIEDAVITVPAYFDENQRQATKDAARLAGINVLRLMNEPTAASLAYGLESNRTGIYAVFDLGGGTFDVSILRLSKGVFEVLATGGDSCLGGDDFDHVIVKFWLDNKKINLSDLSKDELKSILLLARKTKESLMRIKDINKNVSTIWRNNSEIEFSFDITVNDLTQITSHLVEKAIFACKKTILDSKINIKEIDDVILVGGATRLKDIFKAVTKLFKKKPLSTMNPDEVVAMGAALQADLLSGNRKSDDDWLLLDVIPLSLGIETMGGLVEKIIDRNSSIPTNRSQEFTTFKDGQSSMSIHILQGERDLVKDCRSLARFEINGIPPRVAGSARVEVTFQVDADGLLSVTAEEKTSGVKASIQVKPSYGLTDDEITEMLKDGIHNASEDKDNRVFREAVLELKRTIYAVEQALIEDAELMTEDELNKLNLIILDSKSLVKITTSSKKAIEAAHEKLNFLSDPLVARRMNKAISNAIVGKTIDSVGNPDIFKSK
ncbi:MAG: Fe-S protein assembly chaperone HscA [Betaproteobacteria bacterium TMED156]|nr:MAG: Fe-S protein assembly chaperone HscA [Betaproteobacteria bacterium TMED156]